MKSLVQHILSLVSHPVLSFLYRWIYDGELEDTYHEVSTETRAGAVAHRLQYELDCATPPVSVLGAQPAVSAYAGSLAH